MRNRAEKYAVRWCHLTHQVIAGHQFIAVNPKLELRRCTHILFQRFINHIIINKSCQTCPAHIVKCNNSKKTGVTATLLTIIFEPNTARFTSARHVLTELRHHHDTSPNKNKIFSSSTSQLFFYFIFCKLQLSIYKFISKHMRNQSFYIIMWRNYARFL